MTVGMGPIVRDALGEVVNIGCGRALTSLVQMLGNGRIVPDVPQVIAGGDIGGLADLSAHGIAICLRANGPVSCTLCAAFSHRSAAALATALVGQTVEAITAGSVEESALMETGNIVSCAFLGALAHFGVSPSQRRAFLSGGCAY